MNTAVDLIIEPRVRCQVAATPVLVARDQLRRAMIFRACFALITQF
jgi:hypothetical protein